MRLLKDSILSLGSAFGIGMEKLTSSKAQDILASSLDFSEFDFSGQVLERLFGQRPHLYRAWFNKTMGERASMDGMTMDGAEFLDSKLNNLTIGNCSIATTRFNRSSMIDSYWNHDSITRSAFHKTDLRHARFNNCHIDNCDFRGANLQGAHFKQCTLTLCAFDPCWRFKNGLVMRASN